MDDGGDKIIRAIIWAIAAGFSVFVGSIAGCTMQHTHTIAKMVEAGADPIAANCAVWGMGDGKAVICAATVEKP